MIKYEVLLSMSIVYPHLSEFGRLDWWFETYWRCM